MRVRIPSGERLLSRWVPKISILQCIPGHCGVESNEHSDALAKTGSIYLQNWRKIDYKTAKAVINRKTKEICANKLDKPTTGIIKSLEVNHSNALTWKK